jgi:RNA polymerase sigma factor (sigma-70 family)
MADLSSDPGSIIDGVANQAFQEYVEGILSREALAERIREEWETVGKGRDIPVNEIPKALKRIAQRICSQTLYEAWHSAEAERRDCAYRNLRRYLRSLLKRFSSPKFPLKSEDAEDVLQLTLIELFVMMASHSPSATLKEPCAFLRWLQTLLSRQVHAFVEKNRRESHTSLDEQLDDYLGQRLSDDRLQELVERDELQDVLKHAILCLRSPHYRRVLLGLFLEERGESELAALLQVEVDDIYRWKHRALKALRRDPKVVQALLQWLQP